MPRSPEPQLRRFTAAELATHWVFGVLMIVLIATAACLYLPSLSILVGNRPTVRMIHIVSGFLLPVPIILAIASRAFRDDAGRLNRFTRNDWRWLKSSRRRTGLIPVGKFNAGQKLNAAFVLGSLILMFATGAIMTFNSYFPDMIRTGSTFVHDWLALAIVIVVVGHLYMAFRDAGALYGMGTGRVSLAWAEREHDVWAAQEVAAGAVISASPPKSPTP